MSWGALWPRDIRVGHEDRVVTLNGIRMTPAEARVVSAELALRADYQDRTPDTRLIDGVPRRVPVPS